MGNTASIADFTEEEFEDFVMGLDENIQAVTTCLAEDNKTGQRQNGIVLTVEGVDVVLLHNYLEVIVEYLYALNTKA